MLARLVDILATAVRYELSRTEGRLALVFALVLAGLAAAGSATEALIALASRVVGRPVAVAPIDRPWAGYYLLWLLLYLLLSQLLIFWIHRRPRSPH
jgi:hypothetical protein